MPIVKRECIENIKARVGIHDVVAPVVSLKRAGAQFRGLSPFNDEKTPSFFISPDKNLFKCFSSGKAGDIFAFVMETERLSFNEAVETIAERFGIEVEYEQGGAPRESRSLRQELLTAHELAAEFFLRQFLADTPEANQTREYWTEERRFSLDLAREFKIGLAPVDSSLLVTELKKRGLSNEALLKCGLFFERGRGPNASLISRFRGRLMIPIRDHQGRIIAFTARKLSLTPGDDPSADAKYINSPETPLFSKSRVLFGLDRARMAAGEEKPFLMVEGQLDVLRCWEAGLDTAVAPQGTAITEEQLHLLRRYSSRLDCLLDGDDAGQRAALRILPMALKQQLDLRFFVLPPGEDPDTLLAGKGRDAWEELSKKPAAAVAFAASVFLPDPGTATPAEKTRAAEKIFEIISACESEIARAGYLQELAKAIDANWTDLSRDFALYRRRTERRRPRSGNQSAENETTRKKLTTAAESILLICFHYPEVAEQIAQLIDPEWVPNDTPIGRLLHTVLADIQHDMWAGPEALEHSVEAEDERSVLFSLLFAKPEFEEPAKIANESILHLYKTNLSAKINEIDLEIARERDMLTPGVLSLQRKRREIKSKLLNPPNLLNTNPGS